MTILKYRFRGSHPETLASGRPLIFGDEVDASELTDADKALPLVEVPEPEPEDLAIAPEPEPEPEVAPEPVVSEPAPLDPAPADDPAFVGRGTLVNS